MRPIMTVLTISMILTATAAEARRHKHPRYAPSAAPQYASFGSGQLQPDNNGRYVWMPDGRIGVASGKRERSERYHRPRRVQLASLGGPVSLPETPLPPAQKAERESHIGSGTIRSGKTGATARVGVAYAARFQAYIDDLEERGAKVIFMGGIRPGHCSEGSQHPCGKALDVCQLSRGRVDSRCHLPSPASIVEIASRHGLTEGARWCNTDYGHAQVSPTGARDCLLAGKQHEPREHRRRYAGRRHRHG